MAEDNKKSVFEKIRLIPDLITGLGILFIIILETAQCIDRYCFRHTIMFVDDVVVICFSWVVFVGAAVAYRRKLHYGLEVISSRFKPEARPYYLLVIQALTTILFGYLAYRSIVLTAMSGAKILSTTRISYKWVDMGAVIGFLLMTVYGVEFFVQDLKAIRKCKREVEE